MYISKITQQVWDLLLICWILDIDKFEQTENGISSEWHPVMIWLTKFRLSSGQPGENPQKVEIIETRVIWNVLLFTLDL